METNKALKNNNLYLWIIGVLSVVVPVLVAVLFYVPKIGGFAGEFNASFLPHLNAVLNTSTSICLILGFIFIKRNLQKYHITAMLAAFALSSIFLVSYVAYHSQGLETKFGDINHNGVLEASESIQVGAIRYFYYFILLTHIILAVVVVPLVLLAIYFGATKQYIKHKGIVKWTFPVWLYVAITGVLVYLMISPYYLN
jgi:putative membrane protein